MTQMLEYQLAMLTLRVLFSHCDLAGKDGVAFSCHEPSSEPVLGSYFGRSAVEMHKLPRELAFGRSSVPCYLG